MQICVPGNYPRECWAIDENNRNRLSFDSKTFMLIDIHNYSKLCDRLAHKPDILSAFVRNFFLRAEGNFGPLTQCISVNKYIGDAIFCSFPSEITVQLVDVCEGLLNDFLIENDALSKETSLKLSLCIVLDRCDCILGGVRSNLYFDYSYWGNNINQLFGTTKEETMKEGYIWIGRNLLKSLPTKDQDELKRKHFFIPKEVQFEEKIKNYFGILVET